MSTLDASTHLQPKPRLPQIHAWQTPPEHLLDVELPVGSRNVTPPRWKTASRR